MDILNLGDGERVDDACAQLPQCIHDRLAGFLAVMQARAAARNTRMFSEPSKPRPVAT